MNALPALQTVLYDGWVLRFADGYTGRGNAVYPLYASTQDVAQKIETCERWYVARGLRTAFKLTRAMQPQDLDDVLAARGYALHNETCVQTLDLNRNQVEAAEASISLCHTLNDAWLAAYVQMAGTAPAHQPTLRRMLSNLVPTAAYALAHHAGAVVACGLGVLQGEYLGLFDIVTAAHARRQGFGRQIVGSLLRWGQASGAQIAYLQVAAANAPALQLYARFGFQEAYRYWYRIKHSASNL